MKSVLLTVLGLCLGIRLVAQTPNEAAERLRSAEELDKLLAPIALYPDSLVAIILPAASEPSDVVLAARFVSGSVSLEQIDAQPWEESVKLLARYPTVLTWMDTNLLWTRDVGEAYLVQPADVMNSIQRLRAVARTGGLLYDTPQQKVLVEDDFIYLLPANDSIIYVPTYDPEVLILRRPWSGPFISFGIGFSFGNWFRYDCDWHRRTVWVHHRDQDRDFRSEWRRPDHPNHNRIIGSSWRPNPEHLYSRNFSRRDFIFNRPDYFYGRDRDRRPDDRRESANRQDHGPQNRNQFAQQTPPRHDPAFDNGTRGQSPRPVMGPQSPRPENRQDRNPNNRGRGDFANNDRPQNPNPARPNGAQARPRNDSIPTTAPALQQLHRSSGPQERQEALNRPTDNRIRPVDQPRVGAPNHRAEEPRRSSPPQSDDQGRDRKSQRDANDKRGERAERDR